MQNGARSLELGPGKRLTCDVGLDAFPMAPGVLQHNLVDFPYPFPDDSFELVRAHHVLEHIPWSSAPDHLENLPLLMKEVHRMLKPGGVFEIEAPHQNNLLTSSGVPTHRRLFNEYSFRYFTVGFSERQSAAGENMEIYRSSRIRIERRFPGHWWVKQRTPRLYAAARAMRFGFKDAVHAELVK